jgi:hypothetical protein
MARRTKEQEQIDSSFPYNRYTNTQVWRVLADEIDSLVKNSDLIEKTPRRYIVGSLVRALHLDGVLQSASLTVRPRLKVRAAAKPTKSR